LHLLVVVEYAGEMQMEAIVVEVGVEGLKYSGARIGLTPGR
jgi:hypothetical protein